ASWCWWRVSTRTSGRARVSAWCDGAVRARRSSLDTRAEAGMTTTDVRSTDAREILSVGDVDMKVEVVVVPVSDVDRAKEFYGRLGWGLDVTPPTVVQFTPHGSACSVQFGATLTSAAPGSGKGYLVVSDLQATRRALAGAGIEVSEVFYLGPDGPVDGPDPEHRSYFSRATFSD